MHRDHGDLYWDDDHTEAAFGATWDLRENKILKDGIFRHFQAVLVVENPVGSEMWMHVIVEPLMKFSLNPGQYFTKNDVWARLFQRNDQPILLDGRTCMGSLVGQDIDFSSPEFPWAKVVWMPAEYNVSLPAVRGLTHLR